ncbi:TIGR02206 family membrane protein [Ornithinibacillus massiliensis]|uniref:TIGR02206 family membrane protein n=1 Tax=Ornithinibacillus massiliensis TaxID=1944633 RepID=A0ABS5MIY8_9BACI|nr:TIGR02206 family membrane protein [Ornithinibacillus massiliensis]MBS3682291.1 TIGR02206 family membrane protein [Ornithinibacillus massiliensis]
MGEWFTSKAVSSFHLWGIHHLFMVFLFIFGAVLLLFCSKKWITNKRTSNFFRIGLLIILVSSELSYQTWGILNGSWNPREFLPFQLCSIAGIVTMLALLTKNKKIIQVILFIGIVPSFLAVVTPELHHGFPHFRFWQFFIHHLILSWACIFLVLTSTLKITFKKTIESYLYLLCYAAIIGFFINPIFDANFLFLARTPSTSTPLNFLGDGFWYYFNLCMVGLLVFIAIYGVYNALYQFKRRDR